MRSIKSIVVLAILSICVLWSCTDSGDDMPVESIIGTWTLEKYCASPGDASCPWQKPDKDYTYTFFADGTYLSSGMHQSCSGRYMVQLDTSEHQWHRIQFSDHKRESACIDHQMWLYYQDDGKIQINPMCIEQCTYIYAKD